MGERKSVGGRPGVDGGDTAPLVDVADTRFGSGKQASLWQ